MKKLRIITALCLCVILLVIILYYRNINSEPFVPAKWYTPTVSSKPFKAVYTVSDLKEIKYTLDTNFEQPIFEHAWEEQFIKTTLKEFYNKTIEQVVQERKNKRFQFNQTRLTTQKIPNILHYIRIMPYYLPQKITDAEIKQFKSQLEKIPQHMYIIIWIFKAKYHADWITQISALDNRIQCIDIEEYNPIQYATDLFDIFYEHKHYSCCAEVVAYNILYKYGGIYLNSDFKDLPDLSQLLSTDYFFTQKNFIITTHLIGAKPKSNVFWNYLLLLEDLYRYEKIVRMFSPQKQSLWSSSLGLTLVFDQSVSENEYYIPISYSKSVPFANNTITTDDYLFSRKPIISKGVYYKKQNDPVTRKRFGVDLYDYFAHVDNIALNTIVANRKKLEDTFFDVLYNPLTSSKTNIPRIIHKIWLTYNRELSQDQLLTTKNTYDLLSPHWTIIFWTNEPLNIPKTIAYLKKECPEIKIQPILPEHISYGKQIYEAYFSEKRFAHAKDILTINLLYRLGGIYVDMGVDINRDFSAIVQQYELMFYYDLSPNCRQHIEDCTTWNGNHIDIPIIGGQAGEPLFGKWLNNLENKEYKRYNKKYFSTPNTQVAFTATEYLVYILDAFFSDRKVLFLTENTYFSRTHLGSWYLQVYRSNIDLWKIE